MVKYMYIRNFVFIVRQCFIVNSFIGSAPRRNRRNDFLRENTTPFVPSSSSKEPPSPPRLFSVDAKRKLGELWFIVTLKREREIKRETKREREGERMRGYMYYIRTRGNIYMYDVLQQVTHSWCRECTRWAMVHMGNECSVVDGTCCEHTGSFIHRKLGATVE